jgi:hypothetical protein
MNNLTREQAIQMNKEKRKEGVVTYITGISPVYERHLDTFVTMGTKHRTTETFIMLNREYLLNAYLLTPSEEKDEGEVMFIRKNQNLRSNIIQKQNQNHIQKESSSPIQIQKKESVRRKNEPVRTMNRQDTMTNKILIPFGKLMKLI